MIKPIKCFFFLFFYKQFEIIKFIQKKILTLQNYQIFFLNFFFPKIYYFFIIFFLISSKKFNLFFKLFFSISNFLTTFLATDQTLIKIFNEKKISFQFSKIFFLIIKFEIINHLIYKREPFKNIYSKKKKKLHIFYFIFS